MRTTNPVFGGSTPFEAIARDRLWETIFLLRSGGPAGVVVQPEALTVSFEGTLRRRNRAARRRDDFRVAVRERDKRRWSMQRTDPEFVEEFPLGRFRKKDAFDCGRSKCGICHCDKIMRPGRTRQEEAARLSFREQEREMVALEGTSKRRPER